MAVLNLRLSTRLGLSVLLGTLSLVGLSMAFSTKSGCACPGPAERGRLGIRHLQAMQKMVWSQENRWATTLAELSTQTSAPLPEDYTQSFSFTMSVENDIVLIYATPHQPFIPIDRFRLGLRKLDLHSFVAAMTFGEDTYLEVLCESNRATTTAPLAPSLVNGQFICPADTQKR
jgi:Type IV pilin-like G and H, putative